MLNPWGEWVAEAEASGPTAMQAEIQVMKRLSAQPKTRDFAEEWALYALQPKASMFHHIKFTIWVCSQAVSPCFIVTAATVNRPVILGNVKINCPRTQSICNSFKCLIELSWIFPVVVFW